MTEPTEVDLGEHDEPAHDSDGKEMAALDPREPDLTGATAPLDADR